MKYETGSLVRTRGREWVVVPGSSTETLRLRPLGGRDDEIAEIYLPEGELVEDASFGLPDILRPGDYRSCKLLRDAVRIGFRSAAGPFRSFANIACEPRSYQLVPLLMALKLDPVRLLIADDVGIGKTIEACLIAKELIERGETDELAVLCPPHLAEQWQRELQDKFHIETELVLASTAPRLERACVVGQSLFDLHRKVVVSTDFVRSERRRAEFVRSCPNLVIVDEAHTCAFGMEGRGRHLRHELLCQLSSKPERHIILISATPHSGKEQAFRSLIGLLSPELKDLPTDLSGPTHEAQRRSLARYFVQRRRGDISHYLQEDTPFPKRDKKPAEVTYALSGTSRSFFDKVLEFARESIEGQGLEKRHQRVRWWSALALLRAVGSSPCAAVATLRNRAPGLGVEDLDEVEAMGEAAVLDRDDMESLEGEALATAGADYAEKDTEVARVRRRLSELAREAATLEGAADTKLQQFLVLLDELLHDGRNPIIFCRFIATADYLAEAVRKHVKNKATVDSVTGTLAPEDREARVAELARAPRRVLVCTDCLSEGINLQESFDAVVHYDLSWNPTRHEQREGRVDRFGQPQPTVRTVLFYGHNNPMDGLINEVLIRKHQTIKSDLGISVPVPMDSTAVVQSLAEALLLRRGESADQILLPGVRPELLNKLDADWDAASLREKRSHTVFAQETIKPQEVASELAAERAALGARSDIESFVKEALQASGAVVSTGQGKTVVVDLKGTPRALRDALGGFDSFEAVFDLPVPANALYLVRTHPLVQGLAAYVMDTALDTAEERDTETPHPVAARTGVVRTAAVTTRTTLLLLRDRFHILTRTPTSERTLLAEDTRLVAYRGSPENPEWLDASATEALLAAPPAANIAPAQATQFLSAAADALPTLQKHLAAQSRERAEEILAAHLRVRDAARRTGQKITVEPKLPVDLLGLFVLVPARKDA